MDWCYALLPYAKELLPLFAIAQPVTASMGLLPKLGPGRAVFLATRSRLRFGPPTLRHRELAILGQTRESLLPQQYLVLTGAKGVGKSYLIDAHLSRTAGVAYVDVAPGKQMEDIVKSTWEEVTGSHPTIFPVEPTVKRILFCYRYSLSPSLLYFSNSCGFFGCCCCLFWIPLWCYFNALNYYICCIVHLCHFVPCTFTREISAYRDENKRASPWKA